MKEKCELQDYGDEGEQARQEWCFKPSIVSMFEQPLDVLPVEDRWKRWVDIIDR